MKKHELIHTDEKPLSCRYCSKSFRHRLDKKKHEMTHLDPESSSLKKKPRLTRSNSGEKRGVQCGSEGTLWAKGGSNPVGSSNGGADDGISSIKKKPRKKRSDAGQKIGAHCGPEGTPGAKGGSEPVVELMETRSKTRSEVPL